MRSLFLALPLVLAPVLTGCASTETVATHPAAATTAVAARQGVIPFERAEVVRDTATGNHRIIWEAPGVKQVTLYAGTSPDTIDRARPVATGTLGAAIEVAGLAPDQHWFFALVPDRGGELILAERGLGLATVPNLRDAGGYRTADGRWVRMGLVYRSDQLDRLSDGDFARLGALGLGTIADLRTESERTREPDRVPAGTRHVVLDVAADSDSMGGDLRKALTKIAAGEGVAMLTEANREFVALPSARAAYGTLLKDIASDRAPLLYHCTSGKDRTGWASAVLLSLLGVPRETVIQDYLASNDYLAAKNRASLAAIAKADSSLNPAFFEPVLGVRAAFIEAAFAEAETRYGSMEAYARDALGIDAATLEALRAHMLTGPVGSEGPPCSRDGGSTDRFIPATARRKKRSDERSFHLEAGPEGIGAVDPDRVEPGGDRAALDGRDDRGLAAQRHRLLDPADEAAADIAFMDEAVADLQPAGRDQMGEACGGAGAAGTSVDRLVAVEDGVAAVGALPLGRVGPEDVADAADRGIERVDGLIDVTHRRADAAAEVNEARRA